MELDFLRQPVIFIHKFCDKMQIEIFRIQTKTTDNCLLGYGMQRNEGVMENVIVHVLNKWDLKGE